MTFTYTPGSSLDADRVRLLIGDTSVDAPENQRLEDEEITDLLAIYGGFAATAAAAATALAGKFARLATSKSMGQASLVWRRFESLTALSDKLTKDSAKAALPFAGGYSKALRTDIQQNTDIVVPSFQVGMLDNPSTMDTGSSGTTST